jgi:ABC-2 type transport system permease protein
MFSANAFGDLLVAGTMLAVAVAAFDRPWTPLRLVTLAAGIAGGCLLETAVQNVLAGVVILQPHAAPWAFRFQTVLESVGNYPLSILPWAAQFALTFILPIAFIAYLPAAEITGNLASTGLPAWLAYSAPVAGIGLYGLSRLSWAFCLSRYQGANG